MRQVDMFRVISSFIQDNQSDFISALGSSGYTDDASVEYTNVLNMLDTKISIDDIKADIKSTRRDMVMAAIKSVSATQDSFTAKDIALFINANHMDKTGKHWSTRGICFYLRLLVDDNLIVKMPKTKSNEMQAYTMM